MKKFISLAFTILIVMFMTGCQTSKSMDLDEYLENNHQEINLKSYQANDFQLLNSDAKAANIIFTGEMHNVKNNVLVQMNLLKYLKGNHDLKYFIIEAGYSKGYLINKYLETGQMEYLNSIEIRPERDQYIQKLYDYNQTLNVSDRVKVYGIDIERQIDSVIAYYDDILPKEQSTDNLDGHNLPSGEIREDIVLLIDMIDNYNTYHSQDISSFFNDLQNSLTQYEDQFKAYLGSDFNGFEIVTNSLKIKNMTTGDLIEREQIIYSNFIKLYDHLPEGLYYVNYGRFHVTQEFVEHHNPFASMLKDQANLNMVTIGLVYNNSYTSYPGEEQTISELNPDLQLSEIIENKDAVLVKLNAENSPFDNQLIQLVLDNIDTSPLPGEGEEPPEINNDVTTNYYQYIIVISNSE